MTQHISYWMELARAGYEAHNKALAPASHHLPTWDNLPPRIQIAWIIAVQAVEMRIEEQKETAIRT